MRASEKHSVTLLHRKSRVNDDRYAIGVLEKAFEILELLREREEPLSLDEIAGETGIARTTTHRLLHNLATRGYLEKDPERYKYRLGVKLMELGNAVKRHQTLREVVLPLMEELRKGLQETINLGTLHEGEVSYLEILESPYSFRIAAHPGVRDPVHATALGKSILAYLDESEVKQIVKTHGLARVTRKTISDGSALKAELSRVRACGYAVDDEESVIGGRCVGVPILGPEGKVIAGLSVSGPIIRISKNRIPLIARELKRVSAEVSRRLGYGQEHR